MNVAAGGSGVSVAGTGASAGAAVAGAATAASGTEGDDGAEVTATVTTLSTTTVDGSPLPPPRLLESRRAPMTAPATITMTKTTHGEPTTMVWFTVALACASGLRTLILSPVAGGVSTVLAPHSSQNGVLLKPWLLGQ